MRASPLVTLVVIVGGFSVLSNEVLADPNVRADGAADDARAGVTNHRARSLYREAERAFARGRYREAIRAYEEAYELRPLPGFLFNIAQSYRMLGDFDRSVVFFERYLGRYPDSPQREKIERLLATMRGRAHKARSTGHDTSAPTPRPVGDRSVPATAPTESPGPRPASQLSPVGGESDAPSSNGRTALLVTGVGLCTALIVTGLVTGQLASDDFKEHDDPATPDDKRLELKDSATSLRTASIVTLSMAGATALATGLYYWFSRPTSDSPAKSGNPVATMSAAPWLGGGAVVISGRYW